LKKDINLNSIRNVVKEEVKSQVDPLKKDIKKIDKKLNDSVDFLDKDYLELKRKVSLYHPSN